MDAEIKAEWNDTMRTIKRLVNATRDPADAELMSRQLQREVSLLTPKYRTGNRLANLLPSKDVAPHRVRV